MCQRKENEPMMVYLLRYLVEQPRAILACVGMVAAGYMYFDLMAFVRENTANMRDVAVQLREVNTRLLHLEREHEAQRQGKDN
jgi:hypothetical protein